MKINGLKIESGNNGKTRVEIWSTCHSIEDVNDTIAWLQLAKQVIRGWEKINAKASRAPKAPGDVENPEDVWDAYLEELGSEEPSPQGAMAFALNYRRSLTRETGQGAVEQTTLKEG